MSYGIHAPGYTMTLCLAIRLALVNGTSAHVMQVEAWKVLLHWALSCWKLPWDRSDLFIVGACWKRAFFPMIKLHFWSVEAVLPFNCGRKEIKVITAFSLCLTSTLFCLCKKIPFQSFPTKYRHFTNMLCFDWCSIMLWAVLRNSWQVLSVFKYCKKKISYNCYKAELPLQFFKCWSHFVCLFGQCFCSIY